MNNENTNSVPKPEEIEQQPPIEKKNTKKKVLSETEIKLKKAKRTRISVAAFVLLLALGVAGNWYYENSNISATIEPLISSTTSKMLGEAEYVSATTTTEKSTENEYFSSARINRQTARDESLQKLQSLIDDDKQSKEIKQEASEKIAKISSYISIENKIETLVTAKGIDNCIAIVNDEGDRVDIIVDSKKLDNQIIIQIKDIAMEQLGVQFENISIIQSK